MARRLRVQCDGDVDVWQDHPKVLGPGARVGFVQLPDWTYSPVKNNLEDAKKKAASGVAPRCASEGELEMYEGTSRYLGRRPGAPATRFGSPVVRCSLPHRRHCCVLR